MNLAGPRRGVPSYDPHEYKLKTIYIFLLFITYIHCLQVHDNNNQHKLNI